MLDVAESCTIIIKWLEMQKFGGKGVNQGCNFYLEKN